MKGEIVAAWQDATHAYIALAVEEDDGRIEYNASVPLADLDGLSEKAKTEKLIDAAKARRAQLRPEHTDLGLAGHVVTL